MYALILLALVSIGTAEYRRFDGYKVVEILPKNEAEFERLNFWYLNTEMDFWEEPSKVDRPVQIFASPEEQDEIGHFFQYTVVNDHVQEDIEREQLRLRDDPTPYYDYGNFNNYETLIAEVQALAGRCPVGFTCNLHSIGQTHEGEDLWVLSISESGVAKKAIWIDSTIHAREWLATTTMMWILRNLIDNYGSDATAQAAMDKYDFHILAVVNPDGYKFSHSDDRLWRKNRRVNEGSTCRGVDMNRNFEFQWGVSGTSTLPCSTTYGGPSAASEPEIQAVQNEIIRIINDGQDIFAGVSIHTYGNYWLMPHGHQEGGACVVSPDHGTQFALAEKVAQATMAEYGTTWEYGNMCSTLYPASGNTPDFMYGVAGILYAYLPELRGGSFVVDPSQIEPSFNEVWAGLVQIFTHE